MFTPTSIEKIVEKAHKRNRPSDEDALRNLEIVNLQNVSCDRLFAFAGLPSLKALHGFQVVSEIDAITVPFPSNITVLTLENSHIKSDQLKALLEKIPSLQTFRYSYRSCLASYCQSRIDIENLIRYASHSLETLELQGYAEEFNVPQLDGINRLKRVPLDSTEFKERLLISKEDFRSGDLVQK